MRVDSHARPLSATLFLSALAMIAANGCARAMYRTEADREAYAVISERNFDPRWASDYTIEIDPRSRYFDAYDPDHSPMPLDDPVSHHYMYVVDGKEGWKHWLDNGHRVELENPAWREALAEYTETGESGALQLDVDAAIRLAYVHSPSHQSQLETLYLSALDVTAERFRLDTQFFGGYDSIYNHDGSLAPAALVYDAPSGRYLVAPPVDIDGLEINRLTVGRPSAGSPALQARRRFATAGELLAGFANSFVFEFTGGDANLSSSLANFSFIQPLLRGAGKDVALEQLTLVERNLLANLRAYGQFRQGIYTQVTIGELGVSGPRRGGGSTNLTSFSGSATVSGHLGLLRQIQQIRNSEDNLNLQLRTLARLEALLESEQIDLVQVDQFRQSIENERARLLLSRNNFELALDRYKTNTLGLPPDLPIELDDTLIRQFQLIPRGATAIQDSIVELQTRVAELPAGSGVEVIDQALSDASQLIEPVRGQFANVRDDLARMDQRTPARERTMTDEQRRLLQYDREELGRRLPDLELKLEEEVAALQALRSALTEQTTTESLRGVRGWVARFLQIADRLVLVPARARLEAVSVETIQLESNDAFDIALENRLDFMNGRAALVDSWRLIQFNADALQSVLDVTASGDIRTARNDPLSFRAPTGNLRFGLEFDAPFARLLERNAYRESLIDYQRSRRGFIQSRDSLHLGLRALLRQIEQLRENLEIQRRAVTIAIRRVDQTQLSLSPPRPNQAPGVRRPINPTTAINLLSAQSSFLTSQNTFLDAWLNYYAARMRLYRELGIMVIDSDGRWIEYPMPGSVYDESDESDPGVPELPLPPAIPAGWITSNSGQQPHRPAPGWVPPARISAANGPTALHRLPPIENSRF
jgi:hypothetical protein